MRPTSAPMFSLRRGEPELVVPIKPTPHELKKLSDIDDQEGLRFQIPYIMFYNGNPLIKQDPVHVIREALTKALVYYYPFAGRLREGPNRKLMVDCTGEGLLFIEADADVTLMQLGDAIQPPCPCLEKLLNDVPGSESILGSPLLLIQVTRLRCGGFIFAIRVNHAFTDAYGLYKFLDAIARFAQGARVLSQQPVWQREILNARNPPCITCTHHTYDDDIIDINGSMPTMDIANMVHQPFFFGLMEISNIKKHIPPHLHKSSTFELLTACLWKCRTIALDPNPDQVVRLSYTISVSGHINLPTGYYGNAFAFSGVISKAELLCKNQLGYALELVNKVKTQMSEEYIKSTADLMVIKGRPCYSTVWSFIVADTRRAPFGEIDFGWGKPIYGGPAGPTPNIAMFTKFKNSKGEDGVSVMMSLPLQAMERFQEELKGMTQEPENDTVHMKHQRIKSFL